MALKMKENFQKVISGTRQLGSIPSNVYINRAGRAVAINATSVIPPTSILHSNLTKDSNDKSKDIESEDIESVRGK